MEPLTPEQIAALQSENETHKKAYAALENDHLKALEQIEALQNEITAHKQEAYALESKLDATNKIVADLESKVAPAEEKRPAPSFEFNGKNWEVIVPLIDIPKIGIRTAMEIAHDTAAQKYLVEVPGNIGTVIKEVE